MIYTYNKNLIADDKCSDENKFINNLRDDLIEKDSIIKMYSSLRLQIAEHCKLDKVLFICGNGSSLYAGTKSTNDFSSTDYSSIDSVNQLLKSIAQDPIEKQLNKLMICNNYFDILNLEKEKNETNRLINNFKERLISEYVNKMNYKILTHHGILLRKLRNMGIISKTNIFTTNYDAAFEYSFDSLGIEYCDGFSGFINRKFDIKSYQSNKPKIIKMHGSINRYYDNEEIVEKQPIIKNGYISEVDSSSDVLIYPTSKKLEETFNSPYSELIRYLLDALESNQNVVFVLGYKYEDSHINDVILKSLSNPNNIYYFFDYDNNNSNEFLKKIKQLSEVTPNINLLCGPSFSSFEIFTDYIFPSSPSKTDEESLKDILKKVLLNDE